MNRIDWEPGSLDIDQRLHQLNDEGNKYFADRIRFNVYLGGQEGRREANVLTDILLFSKNLPRLPSEITKTRKRLTEGLPERPIPTPHEQPTQPGSGST